MFKRLYVHNTEKIRQSWYDSFFVMLVWAVAAGIAGAFATIAFQKGMQLILVAVTGTGDSIVGSMQALPWWGRILFPVVGGAVAGGLLWAASRMNGNNNADYMETVAIGDGQMSIRQGVLRSLSSLATVASGGSIGREGAMVHMASLGASVLGRLTGFGTPRLRLLVACGAAAGVAAAYGAPLAGALFVAEVVLGSMSMHTLGSMLVSAATANATMRYMGFYHTAYSLENVPMVDAPELLLFALLGLVTGVSAPAFLKGLDAMKRLFQGSVISLPLRLGLGGLLLGLILAGYPQMAGNGYNGVSMLLHASLAWEVVLAMLLLKVVATGITVGSGAIGGVFTPVLFVGGALGWLFMAATAVVWPEVSAHGYLYIIAGMGSFLGAATAAPLMAILMMFEMTLAYQVVLPLMVSAVAAYSTARAIAKVAMYDVTVTREKDAMLRRQLSATRIGDLIRPAHTIVRKGSPASEALQMFLDYPVKYVYVVDDNDVYCGVIALQDLTALLLTESDLQNRVAGDVLSLSFVKPLYPNLTLDEAQESFVDFSGERLPVISAAEPARLLGVVYKSAILEKYSALKRSIEESEKSKLEYPLGRNSGTFSVRKPWACAD